MNPHAVPPRFRWDDSPLGALALITGDQPVASSDQCVWTASRRPIVQGHGSQATFNRRFPERGFQPATSHLLRAGTCLLLLFAAFVILLDRL